MLYLCNGAQVFFGIVVLYLLFRGKFYLLGKIFVFKADDVDSLNITHFKMFIKCYFILGGYIAQANDGKNYRERWERN